jgi:2-methylcitrate dehydratase PrpD
VSDTRDIAAAVTELRFEDLPGPVVEAARRAVLDGFANMLAGSTQPIAGPLLAHVAEWSHGTATIAGHRVTADPFMAAFANGVFCHCLDFEVMWMPPTHPTSPTLPAILALAQTRPPVSGRDLITALVAGFEIQSHLSRCIVETGRQWPHGYHPPGLVGPFGAAAATGRLLGLDVDGMVQAFGIAASRAGSLMANTGTMTKSSHCGHAARMGLESALLATKGYTSAEGIFETRNGFSDAFFDYALDVSSIAPRFGRPFRMIDPGLAMKKYPSQYPTHWSIDAALAVHGQDGFDASHVAAVDVRVGADNESAVTTRPATGLAGKFSITYTVAAALLDGQVDIDTFTDERHAAEDLRDLLPKVGITLDPDIRAMDFSAAWSEVTVTTDDGRTFAARIDRPLGIWDNPLPWDGWVTKYRSCARRAVPETQAEELLARVSDLESVEDVATLLPLLLP